METTTYSPGNKVGRVVELFDDLHNETMEVFVRVGSIISTQAWRFGNHRCTADTHVQITSITPSGYEGVIVGRDPCHNDSICQVISEMEESDGMIYGSSIGLEVIIPNDDITLTGGVIELLDWGHKLPQMAYEMKCDQIINDPLGQLWQVLTMTSRGVEVLGAGHLRCPWCFSDTDSSCGEHNQRGMTIPWDRVHRAMDDTYWVVRECPKDSVLELALEAVDRTQNYKKVGYEYVYSYHNQLPIRVTFDEKHNPIYVVCEFGHLKPCDPDFRVNLLRLEVRRESGRPDFY